MSTALIGHTGLVGSTLCSQTAFDACFNSKNATEMRGRSFSLVVCAAARAEKWKANADPAGDLAAIEALIADLRTIRAEEFVLISTIDVYPRPIDVDENTPIDPNEGQAYGRNRLHLERFAAGQFPKTIVVRLPGLFGTGLKKNFIFDLLTGNQPYIAAMNPESRFQFYDLRYLWRDIGGARGLGSGVVNISTEPVSAGELARKCFDVELKALPEKPPVFYDMHSRYAKEMGGDEHYWYSADDTFAGVRALRTSWAR